MGSTFPLLPDPSSLFPGRLLTFQGGPTLEGLSDFRNGDTPHSTSFGGLESSNGPQCSNESIDACTLRIRVSLGVCCSDGPDSGRCDNDHCGNDLIDIPELGFSIRSSHIYRIFFGLTRKESMYFMVAKDKKIKMIHTGIASFLAVLRLAFR